MRAWSNRLTRASGTLRAAALAAAVAAILFPSLPVPSRARRVAILVDVSDSIGPAAAESSRRAALGLLSSLSARDRAAVVLFAGGPRLLRGLGQPKDAMRDLESAELAAPAPGSTDLGAALALGASVVGRGKGSRLVLVGDGRSNSGEPDPAGALARAGIPLVAMPAGRPGWGLAGLGLELPEGARPGERARAAWVLSSPSSDEVGYELRVDGTTAARGQARLAPGRNRITFDFPAGAEGTRLVEVAIGIPGDRGPGAASASGLLAVGSGASVLVASAGAASPVGPALRAQGLPALDRPPEGLPGSSEGYAGVSCLVLDDLPALEITEAQQAALVDYVAGGGGLLVVGGNRSLGRGEYYATPLEEVLPVETDTRRRLLFTRAKILFVIDHSGSMEEKVGSASKQLAAMRGVAAALDGLGPQDEVGILTFDSTPTWALRFTPASRREEILGALSRLDEGGGTDLASALDEAVRGFGPAGPEKRHAILLTDGLAFDADYIGLARRLKAAGASMSAVAIGDKVNEPLLKDIARWTDGTYYRAKLDQVPRIVDIEAALLTRELIQEGRVELRAREASPMTEGLLPGAPPIAGYLLVKAKPAASVLLEARSAEGADPLLAWWRYGAGKAAVFAGDSGRRWLSSWSGLPAYNRLWAQVVRGIERPAPDSGLRASAKVEGSSARILVEARDEGGRSAGGLRLSGRRLDPAEPSSTGAGLSFELDETAPGRYEALVPLAGPGLAAFDLVEAGSGRRASTWAWAPPGAELAATGPDQAALSRLASVSGGRVLAEGEAYVPEDGWSWDRKSPRLALVALSVALLLAELCVRSLSFGQLGAAREALIAWKRRQLEAAALLAEPRRDDRRPAESRRGADDVPR